MFIIFFDIRRIIVVLFVSVALSSAVSSALALGLGDLRVLSGLGQPLRATVVLLGAGTEDVNHSCIRAKVANADGVFLAQSAISVSQRGQDKLVSISTGMSINEPVVKISVDVICEAQLHRDFLVLLDPPEFLPAIVRHSEVSGSVDNPVRPTRVPDMAPTTPKNIQRIAKTSNENGRGVAQDSSQLREKKAERKTRMSKADKVARDVLRLSDESAWVDRGLKISDTLSIPLEQRISENMHELRAAQRRMAAILRDEIPTSLTASEQAVEQQKMQQLLADVEQLKSQSLIDKSNLKEVQKDSYSRGWIVGLVSLTILSFLMMLGLFFYMRRTDDAEALSWWEQDDERKEVERRKSIEEMVDSVQASYEPVTLDMTSEFAPADNDGGNNLITSSVGEPVANEVAVDNAVIEQKSSGVIRKPLSEEFSNSTFNFFSDRNSAVKVEEISDITQEAEFWMSVNDPERAIEILDAQANVEHPDSPVPWLYLLDLYRLVNDKPKYEALRSRFSGFFNVNLPEFDVDPQALSSLQLEDYPHLIERICTLWNGSAIVPFLESLLVDDRDGLRTGFELPVYRDILLLISIARELDKLRSATAPTSHGESGDGVVSESLPEEERKEIDLGVIEFEAIDFPKSVQFKK